MATLMGGTAWLLTVGFGATALLAHWRVLAPGEAASVLETLLPVMAVGGIVGHVASRSLSPRWRRTFFLVTCAIGVASSVIWLRDLSRREQAHAELSQQWTWYQEQDQRRRATLAQMERELAAADPGRLLSPARLASADGRAQLHEALGKFRALLGQRRASIRLAFDSQARLLDGLPAGERRDHVRERADLESHRFEAAFQDLDRTQEAACDAISTLVGWADAHAGDLVQQGDRVYLRPGADKAGWQDRNDAVARALSTAKAAADRMQASEPAASAVPGAGSR